MANVDVRICNKTTKEKMGASLNDGDWMQCNPCPLHNKKSHVKNVVSRCGVSSQNLHCAEKRRFTPEFFIFFKGLNFKETLFLLKVVVQARIFWMVRPHFTPGFCGIHEKNSTDDNAIPMVNIDEQQILLSLCNCECAIWTWWNSTSLRSMTFLTMVKKKWCF